MKKHLWAIVCVCMCVCECACVCARAQQSMMGKCEMWPAGVIDDTGREMKRDMLTDVSSMKKNLPDSQVPVQTQSHF